MAGTKSKGFLAVSENIPGSVRIMIHYDEQKLLYVDCFVKLSEHARRGLTATLARFLAEHTDGNA